MRLYAKFVAILLAAVSVQWVLARYEPVVYNVLLHVRVYAAAVNEDDAAYSRLIREDVARYRERNWTPETWDAYERGLLPHQEQYVPPWRTPPRITAVASVEDAAAEAGACSDLTLNDTADERVGR